MNTFLSGFMLALLFATTSLSAAGRPETGGAFSAQIKNTNSKGKGNTNSNKVGNGGGGGGDNGGVGSFFGPGGVGGFGIPGFSNGWDNGGVGGGYGAGYGGPGGGYSKGGVIRPTVVCKERGPCYKKKLTCPAKCFTSYSHSGKNGGSGGGGGGCTIDCKKKCTAYC
ncbi:glycine-rich cell wall structural protein-like [Macadamia integrifolia]|uniref:glycine-rich cell wall structural protein-like n=1 Tax=Macadamia integrifolia TaxID=60698 RepID=UPI001C52D4EA|nr:glycine-rich cell wall structural protein-like [Macadamia integrifolia]